MAEKTKIQYVDATFNPWIGCQHKPGHPGCEHCWAERMSGRFGVIWGPGGTRLKMADSTWNLLERWDRKAAKTGEPFRVMNSMCDVFEDGACVELWRREHFRLIDRTPHLTHLLFTKRPENVRRMWPTLPDGRKYRRNCWLVYSASDQASLDEGLPHLQECRDLVPVLGLSLEPLLGPVDLTEALESPCPDCDGSGTLGRVIHAGFAYPSGSIGRVAACETCGGTCDNVGSGRISNGIDWIVVGGETGKDARRCDLSWIRSIIAQCDAASVPRWVKQVGTKAGTMIPAYGGTWESLGCHDRHGADPAEWPEDLKVFEVPE